MEEEEEKKRGGSSNEKEVDEGKVELNLTKRCTK